MRRAWRGACASIDGTAAGRGASHQRSDPEAMQRVAAALPAGGPFPLLRTIRRCWPAAYWTPSVSNSPNRWHVEQLSGSLERGCHVFCEKPLSMVPAEVKTVVEAPHARPEKWSVSPTSPATGAIRGYCGRALQSGRWGRVTSVTSSPVKIGSPQCRTWRHDPARCPGGFFADANGHSWTCCSG